jgi:filamentous hemagglutinin
MTQYVINIGTIPNDGTGDPLRTAFNEVNLNFDQVFAAGPVLSNIRIANNTILTTNTNGNIVLAPNGIGVVQSNVSILPNTANIRNLGSANQRWNTVYTQYLDVSANLTISGNIIYNGDLNVAGNLTVNGDLIEVGNIVTDSKTIQLANTAGNTATANGSGITVGANDLIATYLFNSTANAWTTNIGISAVGNIAAPYFLGNGSQLTGVRADTLVGNTLSSNVLFSSLTSVGTLTNLNVTGNVSAAGNIIGANVVTGGLISATGNVTGGNLGSAGQIIATGNITGGNLTISGSATVTANVSAGNVLTDTIESASDIFIFAANGIADIRATGNIVLKSDNANHNWLFDTSGNLTAPGNIGTSANVAANYFIGDGSQLTGIGASYTNADVANLLAAFGSNVINSTANITTTANVSAAYVLGDGSQLTNLPVQPGTYGDSNVVSLLGAFGSNNISTTGNVTAGFVLGNGSALTSITGANVTGTVANATYATSAGSATTATSATTAGTVTTAAQPNITSVGTLTSVTSSGNIVTSSGNIQGGNLLTTGEVSATGNITGNYFVGNGSQLTGMYGDANVAAYLPTYSGNISGGNIGVTGAISAVGNVTGAYILGNGSQLTGVTSNYGDSNVTTLLSGFGSNVLSTTGNVTSGNLVTSGIVSATGNISTTGNVNSANVNTSRMVIGNIGGSSISADGRIFTPGNIVAGNVNSNGVLFATGNIVGANVNATGNINAGNVNATNLLFSAGNIVGANFDTSGLISAAGNITGNYFFGNGSQLTGIVVSGGTSIDNGTSNVAIPTANGNVAVTANGTYTWSFGADGNLSAPGNISAVGNITGGNILTAGIVSATGNVSGNFFIGNGSQLTNVSTSFAGEMHVSKDGNDSTGTGTILRPYLTITHALTQVGGGRDTVVIHPGEYTENPTITSTNTQLTTYDATGASTIVIGTVTMANVTSRIAGLRMNNLAITGNSQAYINSSTVTEQFTKSSSGYVEVDDCELQVTGNVLISGSGSISIIGNKINNLVVNNAGAAVLVKGADDCLMPQVTAGSLNIVDSIIRASSNTANAVTASAGTVVTLMNNQIVTPAADSVARVSIAGYHSIISLVYDKANSTLSNSLNSVVYFQTANVDSLVSSGNITGGNILTAGIVSATGNITANYFFGNGSQLTGLSSGVQSSIANGTSNVNIATANGNATITANAVTYTFGTNSTLTLPGGSQIRPLGANLDIIAGTGSYVNLTTSDESSSVGVDNGGGYIVTAGGTWDFGTTGNLTAPGNVSVVGNVTSANVNANRMVLGNIGGSSISADGRIFTSGNIVAGNINSNGVLFSTGNIVGPNVNVTGNVVAGNVNSSGIFFATGNITTVGNVIASGNIIGADATFSGNVTANNLSLAGNVTSNIGFTGTTITINNAPGGNEGAEIFWALPSPANTVLNTSLVQDVFQNGMRFFEAGGNSRGLYMDLGNVPNGAGTAVGYRDIPQVSFAANATIAATDAGRHYYSTSASNLTLTIANNTSVSWAVGTAITVVNRGSGNITVAQGTGVSLYLAGNSSTANRTVSTYGMATLINLEANVWMINGTGVA